MRKTLLLAFAVLAYQTAFAQPNIWGQTKIKFENGDTSYIRSAANLKDFIAAYFSGGGTVSSVTVTSANGLAGTVATPTSTPNITLTTTVTGILSGNGTAISAATTTGSGSVVLATSPTLVTPILGTPASGTLTNATGLPISTGVSGLGTGVATFLATPSSANAIAAVTDETGTGAMVFATSPTFVTPILGTPTSATLTNATGLPLSTGVTGILPSANGGTANAFFTVAGPATSAKTFTFPNASSTVLTDNAAVTAAQGGTGQGTYTIGDILQASASTTLSKLASVATGNVLISGGVATVSSWGKVGLTTHVSGILPGANGGTNNGFMDFTGPTTSTKTFTLPNASATILTSNAAVTVAQGGSGAATLSGTLFGNGTSAFTATALGGDVTLYGSNGTAPLYYTLGITNTSAAIGFARASSTLNLNIPDADASFRGTVSTGTQTFAGAKTFSGAATVQGLFTGSAGVVGTATASVAALNQKGALDMDYRTVTATATLAETDAVLYVGTLTADITINLPACNSTRDGWTFRVMKKGTDAFAFILDPATTETFFDGASTKTYFGQGNSVTCQCENGSYWNILR